MAETARSTASPSDPSSDDWLRRVAALTVVPPSGQGGDEIGTATATAAALFASARALLARGVVAPGACRARCQGCADPDVSCDLVRELAAGSPPTGAQAPPPPPVGGLAGYRRALAAAGAAVFTCRRTLHPSGECLFGSDDRCGRVLAAAHRLG